MFDDFESTISAGAAITPSVSENPIAKSSRSARRRHHHRIGRAAIGEGDRRFFRNGARAALSPLSLPDGAAGLAVRERVSFRGHGFRAADVAALLAVALVLAPAIRVGPLDGETCTAVTLYSGQLVAQSE